MEFDIKTVTMTIDKKPGRALTKNEIAFVQQSIDQAVANTIIFGEDPPPTPSTGRGWMMCQNCEHQQYCEYQWAKAIFDRLETRKLLTESML